MDVREYGQEGKGSDRIHRRKAEPNHVGLDRDMSRGEIRDQRDTERSPLAASDSVGMTLFREGVDGPLSSIRL